MSSLDHQEYRAINAVSRWDDPKQVGEKPASTIHEEPKVKSSAQLQLLIEDYFSHVELVERLICEQPRIVAVGTFVAQEIEGISGLGWLLSSLRGLFDFELSLLGHIFRFDAYSEIFVVFNLECVLVILFH